MSTYEYETVKIESKGFLKTTIKKDDLLNEYGKNGWKIVSAFTEQISGTTTAVYYTFMKENKTTI
ncbi:DUF4177 domain-containing protein [Neobacillus vireti]|uniref:DUF4177 domain-containing protein n=1 Tax=Neobacillus vireti LMG 21834 TaxID=1131730 RepID=A0AB94IN61_9BACI|nr:DUF4177 domain-containing protein [Neobacillus vireti]ETI68388.1 hypothetical protein BAVI_12994 [Neobacillus vireti LMG 21834]KLT16337.1 hypothetical protein AA980_17740 [Neobacillus vireti]